MEGLYYPYSEKTKALISFAVTAKLICVFVFAYAKSRFSHDAAQLKVVWQIHCLSGDIAYRNLIMVIFLCLISKDRSISHK